ncbi:MAG: hypothetical protein LBP95_11370 [Deltaproteobacteria bacterium]|jgi:hypothetical protein|nr:hypothetical protein [Deltaproteobacteria bacterium]
MRISTPLTDKTVKNLVAKNKNYKIFEGGDLYIITPAIIGQVVKTPSSRSPEKKQGFLPLDQF